MSNLWNLWFEMWDRDKTMEPTSKKIKKPNYNEPNIED
jgi:hypothetical protein